LTLRILVAILAAFALALGAPRAAMAFHLGGDIFLSLLKMLVVPLVFTSVMSGVLGLGDVRRLGRPGGATVVYFLATTLLAVLLGQVVVSVAQPGVGTVSAEHVAGTASRDIEAAKDDLRDHLARDSGLTERELTKLLPTLRPEDKDVGRVVENLVRMLFTDNLLASALKPDLLPLIIFAIVFAAVLSTLGDRAAGLVRLVHESNEAFMAVVLLFMKVAPFGIFCLVTARFGAAAAEGKFRAEMEQIGGFFGAVLIGLAIHALVLLPAIHWAFTRRNPYRFMGRMSRALLTAFSTASSSATLPLTIETAVDEAGVSPRAARFVIPLGATVNMNGTALYEAMAAIFVAQVAAIPLDPGKQAVIALTSTLAAIGAAGIPEAGLVTMIIVFNAVGLPVEMIGLILSVDWLLDRFRTAVNVYGDCVGADLLGSSFDRA